MEARRFRPELGVLAALAVVVVIAVWFTRSGASGGVPAGTGPGIQVNFTAGHGTTGHATASHGRTGPAMIGVDGTTPSLPAAAAAAEIGKLGLGIPVVAIPDSATAAAVAGMVRRAGAGATTRKWMITARSGETAASYGERFDAIRDAVKGVAPNATIGGGIGEYEGSFLRRFLQDGGSRAAFVAFGFHGEGGAREESGAGLLGALTTASGEIADARSVIEAAAPARASGIAVYVGPWDIASAPDSLRFTTFAAMWDADLLGRILAGGAGSVASGAGLLYDGEGNAPRAYAVGAPTPLYAAIAMFTGEGLFPRFGVTPVGVSSDLSGVDVFAAAAPDEVVVVNTSRSARTTVLHVSGDVPLRAAQWRLGQANGAVTGPVSVGTATSGNGSFALSLPSGSVTTVVVTPSGTASPTVTVTAAATGQCLASDASGAVVTTACDHGARQEWRLSGTTLVNTATGRCLTGDGSGQVSAAACGGSDTQDWYNLGSRLVSAATGRCLNGNGTSEVYALTCDGARQQNWTLARPAT